MAEESEPSGFSWPLNPLEASVDLLEAQPTPGKGAGAQGSLREGDLLKPREERDKDLAGAGHGHGAAAASPSGQGSRSLNTQFGPFLPHRSWDCDLGARWEMSQSFYFPSDLGRALNISTGLHQGERDVM